MAIFAYGRVSTMDQTTEHQRRDIERAGYKVDYWFADEGVSGKTPVQQRPQFNEMLDKIDDGGTLVVSRLDHLGRDATDVDATINGLAMRGIKVIVLQFGSIDLASPAGKPMLTMLAALATMERGLRAERAQSGSAKAQGKTSGRPAKTTAEQRAKIVTEYSQGTSISELARRYNVSRANIHGIVIPKPQPELPMPPVWGE